KVISIRRRVMRASWASAIGITPNSGREIVHRRGCGMQERETFTMVGRYGCVRLCATGSRRPRCHFARLKVGSRDSRQDAGAIKDGGATIVGSGTGTGAD